MMMMSTVKILHPNRVVARESLEKVPQVSNDKVQIELQLDHHPATMGTDVREFGRTTS